jgi:CRP-like cAMP-binding protein
MPEVLEILDTLIHEDHSWLARVGRREHLPKGTVLLREGEPVDSLIFIVSGVVSVEISGLGEVARIANAEIVGEMSLLEGALPIATVTTAGPTNVLRIGRRRLLAKLESDKAFASRFYRAVALFVSLRLRRTIEHLKQSQS